MHERRTADPLTPSGQETARKILQVLGPAIVLSGLLMLGIGLVDFFQSFGSFEPPRRFWCFFVGIPLLFVGGVMSQLGYLGKVSRYLAAEAAPVQRDTLRYMAGETRGAVRALAAAVGEGLRSGEAATTCPGCLQPVPEGARFCPGCGVSMVVKGCPACGHATVPGGAFCPHCGKPLGADDLA